MGCALENLMLAASANGYAATATLLPGKLEPIPADPKPRLVARVDLSAGERNPSELYDAIPRRHTNRSLYEPQKPIPPEFVERSAACRAMAQTGDCFCSPAEEDRKDRRK